MDYRRDLEPASAAQDLTATAGDQLRTSEPAPPGKAVKDNESGKVGKKKQ